MPRTLLKKITDTKENYVINGRFDFWQRNTAQTSSGYGSADRWYCLHNGSTKTVSLQGFANGQTDVSDYPVYYMRTVVSSVAGAANYVGNVQYIEHVKTTASKTMTLSFWAKADSNKNMAVDFHQKMGSGGSPSADTFFAPTTFSLTTSWQKFSVTVDVPSIAGKSLGTDGEDALGLVFWFDAGSNNNSRTNSLGQQSGTFDIANVMFNEGDVAAPFVLAGKTYGGEFSLCQRFFEKSIHLWSQIGAATSSGTAGARAITGAPWHVVNFATWKRKAPSITYWDWAGNISKIRVNGANNVSLNGSIDSQFGSFALIHNTGVSEIFIQWAADSEIY